MRSEALTEPLVDVDASLVLKGVSDQRKELVVRKTRWFLGWGLFASMGFDAGDELGKTWKVEGVDVGSETRHT